MFRSSLVALAAFLSLTATGLPAAAQQDQTDQPQATAPGPMAGMMHRRGMGMMGEPGAACPFADDGATCGRMTDDDMRGPGMMGGGMMPMMRMMHGGQGMGGGTPSVIINIYPGGPMGMNMGGMGMGMMAGPMMNRSTGMGMGPGMGRGMSNGDMMMGGMGRGRANIMADDSDSDMFGPGRDAYGGMGMGMGRGMMGGGMMMGPMAGDGMQGGMHRGRGRDLDLSEDDVREMMSEHFAMMGRDDLTVSTVSPIDDDLMSVDIATTDGQEHHRMVVNRHSGAMMRAD